MFTNIKFIPRYVYACTGQCLTMRPLVFDDKHMTSQKALLILRRIINLLWFNNDKYHLILTDVSDLNNQESNIGRDSFSKPIIYTL